MNRAQRKMVKAAISLAKSQLRLETLQKCNPSESNPLLAKEIEINAQRRRLLDEELRDDQTNRDDLAVMVDKVREGSWVERTLAVALLLQHEHFGGV